MPIRRIAVPWDAQPPELTQADPALRWGMLISGANIGADALSRGMYSQGNAATLNPNQPTQIGACVTAASTAAYLVLPHDSSLGGIVGHSLFWHGILTAVAPTSTRDTLVGKWASTTVNANRAGQARVRVGTTHEITIEVHTGAGGVVSVATGLTAVSGAPLTILVNFTAAGFDLYSTVGNYSGTVASMPTALGANTPGYNMTLGSSVIGNIGHTNAQHALAGWSSQPLPTYLVSEPWRAFAPREIPVLVAAGGANGTASGSPAALQLGAGAASATGGAAATASCSAVSLGAGTGTATGSAAASAATVAISLSAAIGSASASGDAAAAGSPAAVALSSAAGAATGSASASTAPAALTLGAATGSAAGSAGGDATASCVPASMAMIAVTALATGTAVAAGLPAQIWVLAPSAAASNGQTAAPAERTLQIQAESRALRIAAESRALQIDNEPRTLRIRPS